MSFCAGYFSFRKHRISRWKQAMVTVFSLVRSLMGSVRFSHQLSRNVGFHYMSHREDLFEWINGSLDPSRIDTNHCGNSETRPYSFLSDLSNSFEINLSNRSCAIELLKLGSFWKGYKT